MYCGTFILLAALVVASQTAWNFLGRRWFPAWHRRKTSRTWTMFTSINATPTSSMGWRYPLDVGLLEVGITLAMPAWLWRFTPRTATPQWASEAVWHPAGGGRRIGWSCGSGAGRHSPLTLQMPYLVRGGRWRSAVAVVRVWGDRQSPLTLQMPYLACGGRGRDSPAALECEAIYQSRTTQTHSLLDAP